MVVSSSVARAKDFRSHPPVTLARCATLAYSCCTRSWPRDGTPPPPSQPSPTGSRMHQVPSFLSVVLYGRRQLRSGACFTPRRAWVVKMVTIQLIGRLVRELEDTSSHTAASRSVSTHIFCQHLQDGSSPCLTFPQSVATRENTWDHPSSGTQLHAFVWRSSGSGPKYFVWASHGFSNPDISRLEFLPRERDAEPTDLQQQNVEFFNIQVDGPSQLQQQMVLRYAFHGVSSHQTRDLECFADSSSIPWNPSNHFSSRPDCNSTAEVPSLILCTALSAIPLVSNLVVM